MRKHRWAAKQQLLSCLLAVLVFAAGCGAGPGTAQSPAGRADTATAGHGAVSVLYAGALVDVMEHGIAPAFEKATGYHFQGFAAGAVELANQIKDKLRRADIFVSAAPKVNDALMGQANGDWVRWYVRFADAPLVIGYNPKSRFAADLKTRPWYQVMAEPGFRLGRTDPKLDPKGALTIQLLGAAEQYYHRAGLTQQLLGATENPVQVFPEETLVGRLQSGQLDAGFFYSNEAIQAGFPYITPPEAIDPKAEFTVTMVRGAPDPDGALAFARFLLGSQARAIMEKDGLTVLSPKAGGEAAAVPADLQPLLK